MKTVQAYIFTLLVSVIATPSLATGVEAPETMLERVSSDVIKVLKDERDVIEKNPDRVYEIVDQYILPHLDEVSMAKLALGKNWRTASDDEKREFVIAFRDLLVRTYSKSLKEFRDQEIKFFPSNMETGEIKTVVKSEVLQSGGPSIPVAYRMRVKDSAWKVYDIIIDGVSLVTSYRGTFTQEIRKSGMNGLLEMLKDKNSVITRDEQPA